MKINSPASRVATIRNAAVFTITAVSIFFVNPISAYALDVRQDLGGSVSERLREINELNERSKRVRIIGTCVSACTLLLGVKNSCVFSSARLGFHGPTTKLEGIPLPKEDFERVSNLMASEYPEPLRTWFLNDARQYMGDYIVLTGRQVIEMGARPCT